MRHHGNDHQHYHHYRVSSRSVPFYPVCSKHRAMFAAMIGHDDKKERENTSDLMFSVVIGSISIDRGCEFSINASCSEGSVVGIIIIGENFRRFIEFIKFTKRTLDENHLKWLAPTSLSAVIKCALPEYPPHVACL